MLWGVADEFHADEYLGGRSWFGGNRDGDRFVFWIRVRVDGIYRGADGDGGSLRGVTTGIPSGIEQGGPFVLRSHSGADHGLTVGEGESSAAGYRDAAERGWETFRKSRVAAEEIPFLAVGGAVVVVVEVERGIATGESVSVLADPGRIGVGDGVDDVNFQENHL